MTGTSVRKCVCLFVLCCRCKWLLLVRGGPWDLLAVVLGLNQAAVILSSHWKRFLDYVSSLKPFAPLCTCTLAQAISYLLGLTHAFLAQGRQQHYTPQ